MTEPGVVMPTLQEWCRKHPFITLYVVGVGLLMLSVWLSASPLAGVLAVGGIGIIVLAALLVFNDLLERK